MAKRRPLTEEQWLSTRSPYELLIYLQQHRRIARTPGGRRRLRLFCVACCRSVWDNMDERSRCAVEVSERYADGQAQKPELATAHERAVGADRAAQQTLTAACARGGAAPSELKLRACATFAARGTTKTQLGGAGHSVSTSVANARAALTPAEFFGRQASAALRKEWSLQAGLLRCLFGNPFRPVAVDGSWTAWGGGTVARMAQAIYEERAFDRLPVLADAFEDAGCAEATVLEHCRSGGPHARGCWVVDALLGRR
jgi:hypothetical protein